MRRTFFGVFNGSFLAPLSHPRLSLAPPGEKEEPTALFGHVFEVKKCPLEEHAKTDVAATTQETVRSTAQL